MFTCNNLGEVSLVCMKLMSHQGSYKHKMKTMNPVIPQNPSGKLFWDPKWKIIIKPSSHSKSRLLQRHIWFITCIWHPESTSFVSYYFSISTFVLTGYHFLFCTGKSEHWVLRSAQPVLKLKTWKGILIESIKLIDHFKRTLVSCFFSKPVFQGCGLNTAEFVWNNYVTTILHNFLSS